MPLRGERRSVSGPALKIGASPGDASHVRPSILLSLFLASFTAPSTALAQTRAELDEAARQFELAMHDYAAERYDDARIRFERAYDLSHAPELLYNIATVDEILRRDDEARAAYRAYLEAMPDCTDRATIEARLRVLEPGAADEAMPAPIDDDEPAVEPAVPSATATDPAPWLLAGVGGVVLAAGAVLVGVSELDAQTVANAPRWSDAAAAYERAPILSGVGIAALVTGGVTVAVAVPWGVMSASAPGVEVHAAVTPTSFSLEGSF